MTWMVDGSTMSYMKVRIRELVEFFHYWRCGLENQCTIQTNSHTLVYYGDLFLEYRKVRALPPRLVLRISLDCLSSGEYPAAPH